MKNMKIPSPFIGSHMPFYFPCAINIYDDCSGFNENIVVIAIVKASTM